VTTQKPAGSQHPAQVTGQDGTLHAELDREAAELDRFGKVRQHIIDAVLYRLRHWDVAPDAWREADPAAIADAVATHAMAGIAPVLDSEVVATSVAVMRGTLERAGLDPADLPWFAEQANFTPPGGTGEG
jgi:hypothetical protein